MRSHLFSGLLLFDSFDSIRFDSCQIQRVSQSHSQWKYPIISKEQEFFMFRSVGAKSTIVLTRQKFTPLFCCRAPCVCLGRFFYRHTEIQYQVVHRNDIPHREKWNRKTLSWHVLFFAGFESFSYESYVIRIRQARVAVRHPTRFFQSGPVFFVWNDICSIYDHTFPNLFKKVQNNQLLRIRGDGMKACNDLMGTYEYRKIRTYSTYATVRKIYT